jgi:hypothetical protein
LPAHGQTEATALSRRLTLGQELDERLEHVTQLVNRDTGSRVLYADCTPSAIGQRSASRRLRLDGRDDIDGSAGWREAHRIAEEIDKHLAHAVDVAERRTVTSRAAACGATSADASLITCRAAPA